MVPDASCAVAMHSGHAVKSHAGLRGITASSPSSATWSWSCAADSTGYRIFDALFKGRSQGNRTHLVPHDNRYRLRYRLQREM